jgi:hypothetical protein
VLGAMRQRLSDLRDHELASSELWARLMWELDIEESSLSGFDLPADEAPAVASKHE